MANIIEITDINAPQLSIFAHLSEPQLLHYYEPQLGLFIAESPKVITLALDAGYKPEALLIEKRHINSEAKHIISRCGDIPIYTANDDILTQITGFKLTRGALCAMRRHALASVKGICADANRIAVLEDVVNPTNVGAIIRSAAALNIDALLLTPACSDPLYRRALRVSMGTAFQVKWTYLDTSLSDGGLCTLRQLGYKTAAMALSDKSVSISDPRLLAEERLALILGTEGDGLMKSTIEGCDYTVKIPMYNNVDSLNVAAASAVAFWELSGRQ